jgi:BlaI family transcriptional regulator, penicillinase repressor
MWTIDLRYSFAMSFHREAAGLASVFGALELRVLEALWRRGGEVAVRDIKPEFPGAAYTTLMTTMDRLHRKGVLERRKNGRAFIYTPVSSREELESGLVARALTPLLQGGAAQPILSFFVDEISRQDDRLLDELERLVREKRRQQGGE